MSRAGRRRWGDAMMTLTPTSDKKKREEKIEENSRRRVYCSKMPTPVAKGESMSVLYILHTPYSILCSGSAGRCVYQ